MNVIMAYQLILFDPQFRPVARVKPIISHVTIQILDASERMIAGTFPIRPVNKNIIKPSRAPIPAGKKKAKKPANAEMGKTPSIDRNEVLSTGSKALTNRKNAVLKIDQITIYPKNKYS
jgi:hypothetical protein